MKNCFIQFSESAARAHRKSTQERIYKAKKNKDRQKRALAYDDDYLINKLAAHKRKQQQNG